MAIKMKVEGIKAVNARLKKLNNRFGTSTNVSVAVGYSAKYAVYVHENLQARHPNGGQAKFLEQPARQMGPELGQMIVRMLKKGKALGSALSMAGLRLQRASQKLVPVDTGNLKGSAKTYKEKK